MRIKGDQVTEGLYIEHEAGPSLRVEDLPVGEFSVQSRIKVENSLKYNSNSSAPQIDFPIPPNDGKMKGIAFTKDPDGYWIEILQARVSAALCN